MNTTETTSRRITASRTARFIKGGAAREGWVANVGTEQCDHLHRDEIAALQCGLKDPRRYQPEHVGLLADLEAAGLGALLIQDTQEHGPQLLAVCTRPGADRPWLTASGHGDHAAGLVRWAQAFTGTLRIVTPNLTA